MKTYSSLKMISTLFCTIMTYLSFIITRATRCSCVYGYGHYMLDATSKRAQSITAAPVSMVDIRISCPGQSTNETCLNKFIISPHFSHLA